VDDPVRILQETKLGETINNIINAGRKTY